MCKKLYTKGQMLSTLFPVIGKVLCTKQNAHIKDKWPEIMQQRLDFSVLPDIPEQERKNGYIYFSKEHHCLIQHKEGKAPLTIPILILPLLRYVCSVTYVNKHTNTKITKETTIGYALAILQKEKRRKDAPYTKCTLCRIPNYFVSMSGKNKELRTLKWLRKIIPDLPKVYYKQGTRHHDTLITTLIKLITKRGDNLPMIKENTARSMPIAPTYMCDTELGIMEDILEISLLEIQNGIRVRPQHSDSIFIARDAYLKYCAIQKESRDFDFKGSINFGKLVNFKLVELTQGGLPKVRYYTNDGVKIAYYEFKLKNLLSLFGLRTYQDMLQKLKTLKKEKSLHDTIDIL